MREPAWQWKITSAKCVVTEQQGVDVKTELTAVPADLHQQRALLPPGVLPCQGRGINLSNASLRLRWGLEWQMPVMWEEE